MHKSPAYFIFHIYNIFKEVIEEISLLIFESCFHNISFLIVKQSIEPEKQKQCCFKLLVSLEKISVYI